MSSFDYTKLADNPRPQQQEVNMTDIVVHPQNHQYNNPQQQFPPQLPGPRWSWGNLILSICSMFCCQLCGFIATIISILAYVDHKSKDFGRSRNKLNHARNIAITAIVGGVVVCVMMALVMYFLVVNTSQTIANTINEIDPSLVGTPAPYDPFNNNNY